MMLFIIKKVNSLMTIDINERYSCTPGRFPAIACGADGTPLQRGCHGA